MKTFQYLISQNKSNHSSSSSPTEGFSRPFLHFRGVKISFSGYNIQFSPGIFPDDGPIEEISFLYDKIYNEPIPGYHGFPQSLKRLILSDHFNQPIGLNGLGFFPEGLEELTFGQNFQQSIEGFLPRTLKKLNLGGKYHFPIGLDSFPEQLEELILSEDYNIPFPIGFSFPISLQSLTIGFHYHSPLEIGIFPIGLKQLIFTGKYLNPLLPGLFPPSLQILRFQGIFHSSIHRPGVLPIGLKQLSFGPINHGNLFPQPVSLGIFPEGLKELWMNRSFNVKIPPGFLPRNLRRLEFHCQGDFNQLFEKGSLPDGLRILKLGQAYEKPFGLGILPNSLEEFSLSRQFHPWTPGILPESLKSLSIENENQTTKFDQTLEIGSLPNGLEHLKLVSRSFGPLVPGVFPSSLKSLSLTSENSIGPFVKGLFPSQLRELALKSKFENPLKADVLVDSLRILKLNSATAGDRENPMLLIEDSLPHNLEVLELPLHSIVPNLPASLKRLTIGSQIRFDHWKFDSTRYFD